MKVEQAYKVLQGACNTVLGAPTYYDSDGSNYDPSTNKPYTSQPVGGSTSWFVQPDLSNVVDIGQKLFATEAGNPQYLDTIYKALVNHIGLVIFVDRKYSPVVPSLMRSNTEYGSVIQKIDCDMPDNAENPVWKLEDGMIVEQDKFTAPKNVRNKFFNGAVTFELEMSYTEEQLKQSFSSANQLTSFFSMIETKIDNKMSINFANLTRMTINNMIAATMYREYYPILSSGEYDFTDSDAPALMAASNRAINLLARYYAEVDTAPYEDDGVTPVLTAKNCIYNPEFIRYAVHTMGLYSDRMREMSELFNIGEKQRFTPKDMQHFVLLTDFSKAVGAYLQSDTFHDDYVALPKHETIAYWQGTGKNYNFGNTSKISVSSMVVQSASGDASKVATTFDGVLGVIFDHDAAGINNEKNKVTSHYNGHGDFVNMWYKAFGRYYNDYDENCIIFFVADFYSAD